MNQKKFQPTEILRVYFTKRITKAASRLHPMNRSSLKSTKRNNMNRHFLCGIILSVCLIGFSSAQTNSPAPCSPVPSENQLRWQEMEYYAFVHFSLNTYTDQSWGMEMKMSICLIQRNWTASVGPYLQRSRDERHHPDRQTSLRFLRLAF